ncbi:MAG: GGDEF domain-containing protein, partial [Elainellaceae cyanobacterium]
GWDQRLAEEENRCQRHDRPACVIAIDLDGLKQINDRWGHAEGDRAIYRAAQAIQSAVRQHDVVARVGGDEFVVLLTEYSIAASQALLKRLNKSLIAHRIEASFGIAARTNEGLIQAWERADQAMYRQKRRKKLRHIFKRLLPNGSLAMPC